MTLDELELKQVEHNRLVSEFESKLRNKEVNSNVTRVWSYWENAQFQYTYYKLCQQLENAKILLMLICAVFLFLV